MIASAALQNDIFFAGLGVEGLAGTDVTVGGSTAFHLDFADLGGNTALGLGGTMTGQGAVVEDVAQTGTAGDGAALLVGASGVDALGDMEAAAVTGCNTAEAVAVALDTGVSTVLALDTAPVSGLSCDVSVSLILHRIALFSALAPASVTLRTGCAR